VYFVELLKFKVWDKQTTTLWIRCDQIPSPT